MNGKVKRKVEKDGSVRLHEAVSDSVYMRGEGLVAQTLTDFAKPHRLSFLHISDVHGATLGYTVVSRLVGGNTPASGTPNGPSDDVAIINTGDLAPTWKTSVADASISNMTTWNASHGDKPYLMVKGNHDAADLAMSTETSTPAYALDSAHEKNVTDEIVKAVNDGFVTYGDATGYAGYWHKDITHNGVKLRLIALDEYEHTLVLSGEGEGVDSTKSRYAKTYSEAQMTWLVNLLKSTPSDYYIVLCHHHPVYELHPRDVVNDFTHHGLEGQSDTYLYGMSVSERGNTDLPAQIIDAYLHKREATITWVNPLLKTTSVNYSCSLTVDFRETVPAKFACHISGHTHRDFCEHHPNYPEQICLTVASNFIDERMDLVRDKNETGTSKYPYTGTIYLFNRVAIDADRDVVIVDRIGASALRNDALIKDGSARKAIEFPIKKVAVEPKAVLLLKEAFAALGLDFEQFKAEYAANT